MSWRPSVHTRECVGDTRECVGDLLQQVVMQQGYYLDAS